MTHVTDAGEEWEESEDTGIGGAAKGEWRERVSAPAESADHMAGVTLERDKGCIDGGTSDSVVDHVEAFAAGMDRHVLFW